MSGEFFDWIHSFLLAMACSLHKVTEVTQWYKVGAGSGKVYVPDSWPQQPNPGCGTGVFCWIPSWEDSGHTLASAPRTHRWKGAVLENGGGTSEEIFGSARIHPAWRRHRR